MDFDVVVVVDEDEDEDVAVAVLLDVPDVVVFEESIDPDFTASDGGVDVDVVDEVEVA